MTEPLRVLITGSREFSSRAIISRAISDFARENPGRHFIVIVGGARGADRIAENIARKHPTRLTPELHKVTNWQNPDGTKNRRAGFDRNDRMVATGADVCLAFKERGERNAGTSHCARAAHAAGIPVREFWSDHPVDPR